MGLKQVTTLEILKKASKLRVVVGDEPVLLGYHEQQVYAISDYCPHMKASLFNGSYQDGIITCPKHNAQIDIKTGLIQEKAKLLFIKVPTKNAKTYPVTVKDGKVYIEV